MEAQTTPPDEPEPLDRPGPPDEPSGPFVEPPLELPRRTVPAEAPPPARDPEFDPQLNPINLQLDHAPESYQRLVANPFLGVAGIIAWLIGMVALFRHTFGPFTPAATVLLLASLALLPRLFQYHCLDCGATGRLLDWRRHICPGVAERRMEGRTRRLRGPSPPTQVTLWLWVLMLLLIYLSTLDLRIPGYPRKPPGGPRAGGPPR